MSRYTALIDPVVPTTGGPLRIDGILSHEHKGSGVFYFKGVDFEQYHVLKPGQVVTVTPDE